MMDMVPPTLPKDLNDLAAYSGFALNNNLLNRLKRVALSILLEQNARTTNLEFKAFTAHALSLKNGEVQIPRQTSIPVLSGALQYAW